MHVYEFYASVSNSKFHSLNPLTKRRMNSRKRTLWCAAAHFICTFFPGACWAHRKIAAALQIRGQIAHAHSHASYLRRCLCLRSLALVQGQR